MACFRFFPGWRVAAVPVAFGLGFIPLAAFTGRRFIDGVVEVVMGEQRKVMRRGAGEEMEMKSSHEMMMKVMKVERVQKDEKRGRARQRRSERTHRTPDVTRTPSNSRRESPPAKRPRSERRVNNRPASDTTTTQE